jgi:hypothetical protein
LSSESREGLLKFRSRRLPSADSVNGASVGADQTSKLTTPQMIQQRLDLRVEVIIARIVVFGDDFVELCVAAGLDFVDIVGFLADEPERASQVNWASLEESAGVSPAGLAVGPVELVFRDASGIREVHQHSF